MLTANLGRDAVTAKEHALHMLWELRAANIKALLGGARKGPRVTLLLQAELDRFVNALISIREEVRDIENGKLDK